MTNINTFQGKVGIGMNTPGAPLEVQGPNMNDAAAGTSNVISRQSAGHDGVLNTIAVCTGSGEETIGLQTQIDGREYLTDVEAGWNYGDASRYDLLLQPYKGNVGIGTTNPTSMLEVGNGGSASSGSAPGSITVTGTGATKSTGGKPGIYHRAGVGLGLWTDAHMTMEVNGTSGSPLEAMRIKSDGKLGIGTVAPLSRLVVTQDFGGSGPGVPLANVVADDGGTQFGIHVGEKVASPFTRTPLRVVDSGETVLIVDGHSKRVGIGTTAPTNVLTVRGVSGKAFAMSDLRSNAVVKVQADYDAHDGLFIGLIDQHSTLDGDNPSPYLQSNWDGSANARPLLINPLGGGVGIGTLTPTGDLEVHGGGQNTFDTFNQAGALGGTLVLRDDDGASGSGGAVMFGTHNGFHAAIKANLVNGSDNTAGDLSFYTRSASTDSTMGAAMTIRNNNNVGIGITNPTVKLQVGGSTETVPQYLWIRGDRINEAGDISGIHFYNSVRAGDRGNSRIINSRGTDNYASALQFWTNPAGNTPATQKMIIDQNGYVGIGTATPACSLHVFIPSHGHSARIGGYDGVLDIGTLPTTYGAETVYLQTKIDGGTGYVGERQVLSLQMESGGRVGIGVTNPGCTLHVSGGVNPNISSGDRTYFRFDDAALTDQSGGWTATTSIYATHAIVCGSYLSSVAGTIGASDERIKKDITDVDDGSALETLRLLKPKKYKYKDVINRGDEPVWGFIAQEVRETLPYATQIQKECLPNIYELANVSDSNVITLTNFYTSNLESNAMVLKMYDIDDKEHLVNIVEVVDGHSVRVDEDLSEWTGSVDETGNVVAGNQIFVYGQEVDDFIYLQKDAIWTVATAALQEVDRQQQAEKAKVTTLETQVTNLLGRVQALESA
jgi:hypothetical protein